MAVDEAYLARLRTFEDRRSGYSEEFLTPLVGGARSVAVLTRPLGRPREVGWLICHSLWLEQMHLAHLEAQTARALAVAGFPVLRYHGQGYGDSERGMGAIGLGSHLADAADALGLLRSLTGVRRVGVLGARFGGTVAALTAEANALAFLVLWEPVVRGDRLVRDHLVSSAVSTMLGGRAPGDGFVAEDDAVGEIARVDLHRDVRRFHGHTLVVQVSRTRDPMASVARLAEHLRSLGCAVAVESIDGPGRVEFGQFHLRAFPGRKGKADVRAGVDRALVRTTVDWCVAHAGGALG